MICAGGGTCGHTARLGEVLEHQEYGFRVQSSINQVSTHFLVNTASFTWLGTYLHVLCKVLGTSKHMVEQRWIPEERPGNSLTPSSLKSIFPPSLCVDLVVRHRLGTSMQACHRRRLCLYCRCRRRADTSILHTRVHTSTRDAMSWGCMGRLQAAYGPREVGALSLAARSILLFLGSIHPAFLLGPKRLRLASRRPQNQTVLALDPQRQTKHTLASTIPWPLYRPIELASRSFFTRAKVAGKSQHLILLACLSPWVSNWQAKHSHPYRLGPSGTVRV